ncbi:MAG: CHAT domain-containing tetratricopeptide repeat protein [Tahibacter sp.]
MSLALHRCLLPLLIAIAHSTSAECPANASASLDAGLMHVDSLAGRGLLDTAEAADCLKAVEAIVDNAIEQAAVDVRVARWLLDIGKAEQADARIHSALPSDAPMPLRIEHALARADIALTQERYADIEVDLASALKLLAQSAYANPQSELRAHLIRVRQQIRQRQTAPAQNEAEITLAFAEQRFAADSDEVMAALIEIASASRLRGDHGSSLDALERALAIGAGKSNANPRLQARALVMLAQTRKLSGDFERAGQAYTVALEWLARHPEPVPLQLAAALHGVANLHRDNDQLSQSLIEYADALPVFELAYGSTSSQLSQVLNNYANALGLSGRLDEALATYERALDIAGKLGGLDDPSLSQPIGNQSLIRLWQGDFRKAEAGFRRALVLVAGQASAAETNMVFAHLGLAASLWGQGRHSEAFAEAESAEIERQLAVSLAGARLSEETTIQFQEVLRPSLDMVNAIALESGDPRLVRRAWELGMGARGQVTQQTAARLAAGRSARDPALRQAFEAWRAASTHMTQLRLRALSGNDDGAARRAAQAVLDRSERALGRASASTLSALRPIVPSLVQVRAALPPGASLVSFSSGNVRRPEEFASLSAERRARDIYAFVGQADGAPRIARLGDERSLGLEVARWRDLAGRPDTDIADVDALGLRLRRELIDALQLPTANATILLIPNGELARLNFAAFPLDDGRYAVEAGLRFFHLNHETELLLPPANVSATQRVYAVSDPAFAPANGTCAAAASVGLPGTRREVKALRELLPAHAQLTETHGELAQEAIVRGSLAGHDVLHLATHSLDLDAGCGSGARGAGFAFRETATDPTTQRIGALLLAPGPADDGLLTETEIAALDLSAVRWAVLSACDTALGESRAYEGAFGLRRAFALAGARTVIMSLWRIDDDASVEWMTALYRARWRDHADSIAALHTAMSETLRGRRATGRSAHPYYWAGFVAAGDWR